MDLPAIIRLKEKIAISPEFTPGERNFILEVVNITLDALRSPVSDEGHAAGRTKAGNDIGGV